jgi:hypothetical protein
LCAFGEAFLELMKRSNLSVFCVWKWSMENPIPRPEMRRAHPALTKQAKRRLRKRAEHQEILAKIDPHVQQERLLVECYLTTGNKAEALRRAGYEPDDPSPWSRPSVGYYLAQRRAELVQDPEIATAETVLRLLTTKAMTSMRDYVRRDSNGGLVLDFSSVPDYKLALIKELETEYAEGEDGSRVAVATSVKLDTSASHDALVKLAQRLGLLERDRSATTEVHVTLNIGAGKPVTVIEGDVEPRL